MYLTINSHIGKPVQMGMELDAISILLFPPPPHFSFVSDLELRSVVDVCSFDIQIVSFLAKKYVSGIDGIKMTETEKVGMDRIELKTHRICFDIQCHTSEHKKMVYDHFCHICNEFFNDDKIENGIVPIAK